MYAMTKTSATEENMERYTSGYFGKNMVWEEKKRDKDKCNSFLKT